MTLYLVRHGESEDNAANRDQALDSPLTTLGHHQAELIAQRLAKLPIQAIVSSDAVRTQQTSEALRKKVDLPFELDADLRELKHPSHIIGLLRSDPYRRQVLRDMHKHDYDAGYHLSDEENFYDFKNRCRRFLHKIEQRPEEHIAVITHGGVIHMLCAIMMFGKKITPAESNAWGRYSRHSNTGLTIVERGERHWNLLTWNDLNHLAETE